MDLARWWGALGWCGRSGLRWLARALRVYGSTVVGSIWVTPYHYNSDRYTEEER